MKIQPGIYDASIVSYGIGQTRAGDPQAMILFEYNDLDGHRHEVTWYGSFKEGKAQEITLKALLTCGFRGNDPSVLSEGVLSEALELAKAVKITIDEDTKQDGTKFMRVRWINELSRELKSMDRSQAKVKLGALNLAGQLAVIRSQLPTPKPAQPSANQSGTSAQGDSDDFSFGMP